MTQLPKISIITPSYNQGQFIEQTIQSVLNQNYPNLEYIVIDGGSSDNTLEILKKYDQQITYWVSEKDRGQSHAINKGLEKCTGEIFNWLNSDDYLEPGALHKIARTYLSSGGNFIIGTTKIHDLGKNTTSEIITNEFATLGKTISKINFWQPSAYMLLEDVKKVGQCTESLHYGMDTELYIKILLMKGHKGIRVIPDTISHYRIHDTSKTGSQLNKFHGDVFSIFHQLALAINDKKNANKIEKIIAKNQIVEKYKIQLPFTFDEKEVRSINENNVYNYLNIFYTDKNVSNEEMRDLAKHVDLSLLEPNDKMITHKISTRLKWFSFLRSIKTK